MPKTLKQKQDKAVEYAKELGKLLDPLYFDEASKAFQNKNKDGLRQVFKKAQIPESYLEEILADYPLDTGGWGWGWG